MEIEEEIGSKQARRWILTINNPTQSDEDMCKYVEELEHFKYCCFQREKGHETGTEHFQLFIVFSIGKRFATIKNYFPTAHIEKAKGLNIQCREYCTKSDTRVSGPYELGQFAEERARTDKRDFLKLVQSGATDKEIADLFPDMYLDKHKDIPGLFRRSVKEQYKNKSREIEVTYIYGAPRSGKTRTILDKYDDKDVYRVTLYNNSAFDDYKNEDVIIFDEFYSQFKITDMNNYLDRYYIPLPGRYDNRFTLYTKVFIISNLPLSKQYVDIQERDPAVYNAFVSRIHNIYRKDELDLPFVCEKRRKVVEQTTMRELQELSQEQTLDLPW